MLDPRYPTPARQRFFHRPTPAPGPRPTVLPRLPRAAGLHRKVLGWVRRKKMWPSIRDSGGAPGRAVRLPVRILPAKDHPAPKATPPPLMLYAHGGAWVTGFARLARQPLPVSSPPTRPRSSSRPTTGSPPSTPYSPRARRTGRPRGKWAVPKQRREGGGSRQLAPTACADGRLRQPSGSKPSSRPLTLEASGGETPRQPKRATLLYSGRDAHVARPRRLSRIFPAGTPDRRPSCVYWQTYRGRVGTPFQPEVIRRYRRMISRICRRQSRGPATPADVAPAPRRPRTMPRPPLSRPHAPFPCGGRDCTCAVDFHGFPLAGGGDSRGWLPHVAGSDVIAGGGGGRS